MDRNTSPRKDRRTRNALLIAITVILAGWALHATGAFMVPIVFSVFLALLVGPLDQRVANAVPEKIGWLGHVTAIGTILIALLIFVSMIGLAAQQVVERFPSGTGSGSLLPQFGQELRSPTEGAAADAAATGSPSTSQTSPQTKAGNAGSSGSPAAAEPFRQIFSGGSGSLVEKLGAWASGLATKILGAASGMLVATVLVIFLTLLMLIEAPRWRQKTVNLLDVPARKDAIESISVISNLLRHYLLARTILGVITAVLYVTWLWIFGIDLLMVWGLLAFALNYVPTFGSLIAGALPVLYAVVQKDPGTAIAIGTGIFVIEQVMGNYVDPRVQGRQVSLSSLIVLITLLVWSWIWGVAGAILAVPITIAAMIICAHITPLRPFALMLSDARDMEELDRQVTHGSDG